MVLTAIMVRHSSWFGDMVHRSVVVTVCHPVAPLVYQRLTSNTIRVLAIHQILVWLENILYKQYNETDELPKANPTQEQSGKKWHLDLSSPTAKTVSWVGIGCK